jgi:threonine aldolase
MIDLPAGRTAAPVVKACAVEGVLLSAWAPARIRAVTHLDVSAEQVKRAGEVLGKALEGERG